MTIACPTCGSLEFDVVRTIQRPHGILRRRSCLQCDGRFTTLEVLAEGDKRGPGRKRKYTALQHLYLDLGAALSELGLTDRSKVRIKDE